MKMSTLNCKRLAVIVACSLVSIVAASAGSDQGKVILVKNNTSANASAESTAKTLQELAQAEIDASFLVSQAMDNVNNSVLREKLLQHKQQCEKHIGTLSELVIKHGRQAPTYSKDFKGFFMQGYAAMRGLVSDQGVMTALHTNLQRILKVYESHLNSITDDAIKSKVKQIYDEDKEIARYVATQQ